MTVREFIRELRALTESYNDGSRVRISRDHIHILVILTFAWDTIIYNGYGLSKECAQFIKEACIDSDAFYNRDDKRYMQTCFEFYDDGSLDDERGMPIGVSKL